MYNYIHKNAGKADTKIVHCQLLIVHCHRGGYGAVGSASDCGSEGRGFETLYPPSPSKP